MSSGWAVPCLLLAHLLAGAHGFGILPGKSMSHMEITETAILNTTVQVCRALAQAEGADFTLPVRTYFSLIATLAEHLAGLLTDGISTRVHRHSRSLPRA